MWSNDYVLINVVSSHYVVPKPELFPIKRACKLMSTMCVEADYFQWIGRSYEHRFDKIKHHRVDWQSAVLAKPMSLKGQYLQCAES